MINLQDMLIMKIKHHITYYDFRDGKSFVPAYQHPNGGGWVACTSNVSDNIYLSKDSKIFGNSSVNGDLLIYDGCEIFNNSYINANGIIRGAFQIKGDVKIEGHIKFNGSGIIGEHSTINGNVFINGLNYIYGYSKLIGNLVIYSSTFSDEVEIINNEKVDCIIRDCEISNSSIIYGSNNIGRCKISGFSYITNSNIDNYNIINLIISSGIEVENYTKNKICFEN